MTKPTAEVRRCTNCRYEWTATFQGASKPPLSVCPVCNRMTGVPK